MPTVTITGPSVRDSTSLKDNRPWFAFAAEYQDGGDGGVVTPRKSKPIYPSKGVLTIELEAGIAAWIQNPDGNKYLVTVPNTNSSLWDVIAAGVAYPPDTRTDVLASAVDQYVETARAQFRTRAVPVNPEDPNTLYQWVDEQDTPTGSPVPLYDIISQELAEAAAADALGVTSMVRDGTNLVVSVGGEEVSSFDISDFLVGPDDVVQTTIENIIGNYESETLALFDRMTVRPDTTHRTAINTLIKTLKTNGVWAKLDSLYVMAAHTSQAGLLNWKANARNLIAYNSPLFTADRGFAGDGVASYLGTQAFSGVGLLMAQGNESMGCWIEASTVPASNGTRDISLGTSSTGGSSNRNLLHRTTTNTTSLRMNNTTTLSSGTHTPFGNNLMSLSHDGTNVKAYWNGVNDYTSAVAPNDNTQTLTTLYTVLGRSGTAYTASQYGMAFTGSLLTAGNHANLYNAVYDYMNALGAI